MIETSLFPTYYTNTYGYEGTKVIPEIPIETNDFTKAYWLGYKTNDDLPSDLRLSEIYYRGSSFIFSDAVPEQNFDYGLLSSYSTNYRTSTNGEWFQNSGEKWETKAKCYSSSVASKSLINKLNLYTVNSRFRVYLQYGYTSGFNGSVAYFQTQEIVFDSAAWFENFLNNQMPITYTENLSYIKNDGTVGTVNFTKSIMPEDFTENPVIHETVEAPADARTQENKKYWFTLTYTTNDSRDYSNSVSLGYYTGVSPMFHFYDMDGNENVYAGNFNGDAQYTLSLSTLTITPTSGNNTARKIGNFYSGGFVGTVDISRLMGIPDYEALNVGNIIFVKTSVNQAIARRTYTIDDIRKAAAMLPHFYTGDSGAYGPSDLMFFQKVEGFRITTDFYRGPDDAEMLRDWQKGAIETNTYTEEDRPQPAPPEPSDDNDEGNITLNRLPVLGIANNFITYYVLNGLQCSLFGQNLWSNLAVNYMENFYYSGGESKYTVSFGDVINYVVSLKYFPLNVARYCTQYATDNAIAMGTGVVKVPVGLPEDQHPYVLNPFTVSGSFGSVEIPAKYNNFMDFEPNTSCVLYVPFCGTKEIPLSVVKNSILSLEYCLDLVNGTMTAYLMKNGEVSFPITEMTGKIAFDLPVSGNSAASAVAQQAALATRNLVGAVSNFGKSLTSKPPVMAAADLAFGMGEAMINRAIDGDTSIISVMSSVPSGDFSSLLAPPYAYIQIRRHNAKNPNIYGRTTGNVYMKTAKIGDLSGFTVCENVNVSGIVATETEKQQIKQLLESGVYL